MLPRDSAQYRQQLDEYTRTGSRKTRLARGRALADQWVAAKPSEGRALMMYATILASLGDVAGADSMLCRTVLTDTGQVGVAAQLLQLELHMKSWHAQLAAAVYDTIRSHPVVIGRLPSGPFTTGNLLVLVSPIFGRISQYDSLISASIRQSGASPSRERFSKLLVRTMMGMTEDSLAAALATVYGEIVPLSGNATATRLLAPILDYSLRSVTEAWPLFDTAATDARAMTVIAAQRKDTAALRRSARRLDSLSTVYIASLVPDAGVTIVAADAFLARGDRARALRLARRWLDSVLDLHPADLR